MKLYCESCDKVFSADKPETEDVVRCPHCTAPIQYPATPTSPGSVIGGDFLIQKLLGMGGMGEVFLAKQISLDRQVALKVLLRKYANDREYIDGLFREARAAAKLNHPNIVQAYAIGEEDKIVYFAMEYVPGKTFKQVLREEHILDFVKAAKVIKEIASALDFAWNEQKLVHQDIKPDNIMLDNSGRSKLADLGLARNANAESDADSDEVLGTPQYISPEQLTGVPTDVRSDIYSLGATFYQFVTGRFAYVASTPEEMAKLHVTGSIEPPKQVNPELPDELNAIILKMMARNITERYQTPQALIKALNIYLKRNENSNKVPSLSLNTSKNAVQSTTTTTKKPLIAKTASPKPVAAKPPTLKSPALAVKKVGSATPVAATPPTPVITPVATPVITPVATPATDTVEETPVPKETTRRNIFGFLRNRAVIISVCVAGGIILLLGVLGGGVYWLHRNEKLPLALKPYAEKMVSLLPNAQRKANTKENTPLATTQQVSPKTNVPAVPPAPVTRAEYVEKAQRLIDWNRNHPGSTELSLMVEKEWNYLLTPQTVEEQTILAKLGEIWAGIDENYRFAPARQKLRDAHRAEIAARRKVIEDERKAKEALREQALREQQQLKEWEEEARRSQAENQRHMRERIARNLREIETFYPQLTEGFYQLAINGDNTSYQNARQAVNKYSLAPTANAPEETRALRELRNYSAGIPKAAGEVRSFIDKLGKISRNDGWRIVVPRNRTGLLASVRPGSAKMIKPGTASELVDLPLENGATARAFFTLLEKNISPNARFYYALANRQSVNGMEKQIPNGFFKTYWKRIKTGLR